MNAAVVICLDRNKLVEQEYGPPVMHFYESEAVTCVKSWRKNALWDKKIYAVQYSGRKVSDKTVQALKQFDVNIITLQPDFINRPFMDVVYALRFIESCDTVTEDRILYSDLDIIMQKPIPRFYIESDNVILYHYCFDNSNKNGKDSSEFKYRMKKCKELNILCHNTYFQAFNRNKLFQQTVYDTAQTEEYRNFFEQNIYYKPTDDDYFFEEGLYDYVCSVYKDRFKILDLECPADFFEHVHFHKRLLNHEQKSL